MDFFQHQDDARRRTGWLLCLILLSVVAIIVAIYLPIALLVGRPPDTGVVTWWHPRLAGGVAAFVVTLVVGAMILKRREIDGSGTWVAQRLGGTPVRLATTDPRERQLINIVEEMAIASGISLPLLFVLNAERGINAFAAGLGQRDAVVAVTRGALEHLERAQLQGVIAHEFSHVLHGDMRLNMHLIGILAGIAGVGHLGAALARAGGGRRPGRWNNDDDGHGKGDIMALGLGSLLYLVGGIGLLFASLIKAAVSRQREFLADAAAVQFTRHPEGLAGALVAIANHDQHALVMAPAAPELSHFFFGAALKTSWLSWAATHPPVTDRVRRLAPHLLAQIGAASRTPLPSGLNESGLAAGLVGPGASIHHDPNLVVDEIAAPTAASMARSATLLSALPDVLRAGVRQPVTALATIYLLLLDPDPTERDRQGGILNSQVNVAVLQDLRRLWPEVRQLSPELRLPLVELAMPALSALAPAQRARCLHVIDELALSDANLDLFELALQRVVRSHLVKARANRGPGVSLDRVRAQAHTLLSAIARAGHPDDPAAAKASIARGASHLGAPGAAMRELVPEARSKAGRVGAAMDALARCAPADKRRLVDACAHAVLADDHVTVEEGELLRAVCATLGCPLPPVLA